jgi:hypothetical protein
MLSKKIIRVRTTTAEAPTAPANLNTEPAYPDRARI